MFKAPGSGDRKYEDTYLEGRAGFLPQWTGHILKMPIKYKQGEKTAFRMGENNSKQSNRQRINLKNIQATPAAQFQKNK